MDQCKDCIGGSFCDMYGASAPTGLCDAGYYCQYGVDRARPTGSKWIMGLNYEIIILMAIDREAFYPLVLYVTCVVRVYISI